MGGSVIISNIGSPALDFLPSPRLGKSLPMTSEAENPLPEPPDTLIKRGSAQPGNLEIKDSALIFKDVWRALEKEFGRENLRFPKEIILLGGAPGAGKGTNTEFILEARGLTCPPIVVSGLLDSPEAQRIKDAGMMVGDREVLAILLRELLKPEYADGCILDGFPRTEVQVDALKQLVTKMHGLREEFHATPLGIHFRQPTVHIMVPITTPSSPPDATASSKSKRGTPSSPSSRSSTTISSMRRARSTRWSKTSSTSSNTRAHSNSILRPTIRCDRFPSRGNLSCTRVRRW